MRIIVTMITYPGCIEVIDLANLGKNSLELLIEVRFKPDEYIRDLGSWDVES